MEQRSAWVALYIHTLPNRVFLFACLLVLPWEADSVADIQAAYLTLQESPHHLPSFLWGINNPSEKMDHTTPLPDCDPEPTLELPSIPPLTPPELGGPWVSEALGLCSHFPFQAQWSCPRILSTQMRGSSDESSISHPFQPLPQGASPPQIPFLLMWIFLLSAATF